MRANLLLLLALCVIGFALNWAATLYMQPQQDAKQHLFKDVDFADMFMTTIEGDHIYLSRYNDHIIILNFWASWCVPCVVEFPRLIALAERDEAIQVILISVDDTPDDIRTFLDRMNFIPSHHENVHVVHDANQTITRDGFNIRQFPETIILNPGFDPVRHIKGANVDFSAEQFYKTLINNSN